MSIKQKTLHVNSLGERIKFFRRRLQMSQMKLEIEAGLASGSITRIERDVHNPSKITIAKIGKALDLSHTELAYLFEINLYLKSETYTLKETRCKTDNAIT